MEFVNFFEANTLTLPYQKIDAHPVANIMRTYDNIYDFVGEANIIIPFYKNNSFHVVLGIDKNKNIIRESNSFLTDKGFIGPHNQIGNEYDVIHTCFSRIFHIYDYLITHEYEEVIEEECFLMFNPFTASNIGHDISIMFERAKYYITHKLACPIVLSPIVNYMPNVLAVCSLLLPNIPIIMIDPNKIYKFKKIHITTNVVFNIKKHQDMIDRVRINAISTIENIEKYANKKIFLVKNTSHKNVISKYTCYTCNELMKILEDKYNYIIINPETMNMTEIIAYLSQATVIITSHGAILYGNGIFFNPAAKHYFLSVGCGPYYDVHRYTILELGLDLDSNIPYFLQLIGEQP